MANGFLLLLPLLRKSELFQGLVYASFMLLYRLNVLPIFYCTIFAAITAISIADVERLPIALKQT